MQVVSKVVVHDEATHFKLLGKVHTFLCKLMAVFTERQYRNIGKNLFSVRLQINGTCLCRC